MSENINNKLHEKIDMTDILTDKDLTLVIKHGVNFYQNIIKYIKSNIIKYIEKTIILKIMKIL